MKTACESANVPALAYHVLQFAGAAEWRSRRSGNWPEHAANVPQQEQARLDERIRNSRKLPETETAIAISL
jgi:hypothetical protein